MMKDKLNLGCANDIRKEHINLDFVQLPGVDVVHNINKFPWPFKKNSFKVVFASHILEHVDDLIKTMKEIHRICKPNARVIIRVPHFSCGVSYRDPTHKRVFSYFTFDYFSKMEGYDRKEKNMFKIKKRKLNFTRLAFTSLNKIFNPLINISPAIYERLFCWSLPCSEVIFELEVKK